MHDIARHAGVSQATVSLVLNKRRPSNGTISEETRQRVLASASSLNYRTNELAKSMSTGKNRVLGVLTSPKSGENTIRIMTGAIAAAEERGYLYKVLHLSYRDVNKDVIARCQEWRLAGVMAFGLEDEKLAHLDSEFANINTPFALVDSVPSQSEWAGRFYSDDGIGIQSVVTHLAEKGHTHIGFVGGAPSNLSDSRERAFCRVLGEMGFPVHPGWIRQSSWEGQEIIEKAVLAVFQDASHRPTAVACASDAIAMVVLRVARSLGMRVPEDLSITGYGNTILSAFVDPPLTTVDQPFLEIGQAAALYLIDRAEDAKTHVRRESVCDVVIPTKLLERGSTAPCPR